MAEFNEHRPGTFCWMELATTDPAAAKRFYGRLFGWGVHDIPIGEGQAYSMFQLEGRDIGAAYRLDPQSQKGMPPHWGSYVSVASADRTAEKAKSLGGRIIAEPFDVFDSGRMAVLADPSGALLSVWQAKDHVGVGRRDEPGTLCWNELGTRDTAAASKFYAALFGWTAAEQEMPMGTYTLFQLGGAPVAGMYRITEEMDMPSAWCIYIAVEDCDATVVAAAAAGGRTLVEPLDIPGVGRMATLADPQGAAFSVLRFEPAG